MITSVDVTDIVNGLVAYCPDCRGRLYAYLDPEGAWIECDCDAGYMFGRRVSVLV